VSFLKAALRDNVYSNIFQKTNTVFPGRDGIIIHRTLQYCMWHVIFLTNVFALFSLIIISSKNKISKPNQTQYIDLIRYVIRYINYVFTATIN